MSAIAAFLISNPLVAALIASILGGFGWGIHQRFAGAKAERNKQAANDAAAATEAQKIDDAVAGRPPEDNRKELSQWSKS